MALSRIAEFLYFFFVGGLRPEVYCSIFRRLKLSSLCSESTIIQVEGWRDLNIKLQQLCQPSTQLLVRGISYFNNVQQFQTFIENRGLFSFSGRVYQSMCWLNEIDSLHLLYKIWNPTQFQMLKLHYFRVHKLRLQVISLWVQILNRLYT